MQVRVLLFASLREAAGASELLVTLDGGATASAVLSELQRRLPDRRELLARSALAVNEEYSESGRALREGDTVAVIPPVSGGSQA